MSIQSLLIQDTQPLGAALETIDANGFGLAFAIDGEGRFSGVVGEPAIRQHLAAGGSLGGATRGTVPGHDATDTLSVDADDGTIARRLDGSGAIIALLDRDRRPVDYASAARKRRIPVAEPQLSGNERAYIQECLDTNWISSQGPFVKRFEDAFAKLIGVPHAISASSGTTALHLALLGFGIGPGDEVIVPDLTFAASINTVLHCGATPVIVDVDPASWNIDPAAIAAAITPRSKAIMPVHLYGQPAAMDEIMRIARRHDLLVIEDAAEAAGSLYRGRPAGAIGDASAFSFFSNKLITTGEGGMVVFQDAAAAERARRLRDHGMDPARRYWHQEVGYNYRLTNLQAAIGLGQLEQIDRFLERKLANARGYRARLGGLDHLTLPAELPDQRNSFWMFCMIPDCDWLGIDRGEIMARCGKAGFETRPLFYPLHDMPPYRAYAGNRDFPVTDRLSKDGMSLPSGTALGDDEIAYVGGVVRRLYDIRALVRETQTA